MKISLDIHALTPQVIGIEVDDQNIIPRELRVCIRVFEYQAFVKYLQKLAENEIGRKWGDVFASQQLFLNVFSNVGVLVREGPNTQAEQPFLEVYQWMDLR